MLMAGHRSLNLTKSSQLCLKGLRLSSVLTSLVGVISSPSRSNIRMRSKNSKVALIVKTFNAQPHLDRLLAAIARQSLEPNRFLAIDSGSTDGTPAVLAEFGAEVYTIPANRFDDALHRVLDRLIETHQFVILLDQDAIPVREEAFANLLDVFSDSSIGLVYGRQLPRDVATAIEAHSVFFSFPDESSIRSLTDRQRLGMKTIFCSNAFAAYRTATLSEVDVVLADILGSEDQTIAGRMLLEDWKLAYSTQGTVIHSRGHTIWQDCCRQFQVGVSHANNRWLLNEFARTEWQQRLCFLRSEAGYLASCAPELIPLALLRAVVNLAAYELGFASRYRLT